MSSLSDPAAPLPSLPPHDYGAVIGEGGMGCVVRATDLGLQRPVAIKRLHRPLCGQPDVVERFKHAVGVDAEGAPRQSSQAPPVSAWQG